jgi:hypothetical protein
MNGEDHATGLGKIVSNLQSLELLLRVFLCDANKEHFTIPNAETASVPKNYLTNYDPLGRLIDKYNARLSARERPQFEVDRSLVNVRDAIAHGRLCSPVEGFPLTLYKFGKPDEKTGSVPVEAVISVSDEWLKTNVNLTRGQMEKVVSCANERGYKAFGT